MRLSLFSISALCLLATTQAQAQITMFTDRVNFNTVVGATTVEDFTGTSHFPITSGILNSSTNQAGITPGTIKPGVTYSTPIGTGNFFNIDAGGGYVGGFLDRVTGTGGAGNALQITFDGPVRAFGFDTNDLMGSFTVGITYSGTPYSTIFSGAGFYGFQSGSQNITGATVFGTSAFVFDLDNFSFTSVVPAAPPVPEPGSIALLLSLGTIGAAFLRRKQARKAV